jgi:hypothetical protein
MGEYFPNDQGGVPKQASTLKPKQVKEQVSEYQN